MEDLSALEDLEDVEIIYSDSEEGSDHDNIEEPEEMLEDVQEDEVEDTSKLTFTKHTRSLFCADLSKNGQRAVTGAEDDCAYVWSTTDGEVLLECTGHKDSVTEVCFNHDDKLVATGDMSGMIQVWNLEEKKLVWCTEAGDDLEWMMWHPLTNFLLCGHQSGSIYVWQIPSGRCKVIPSHGAACTCSKLLPDGKRLIAGYAGGQVKLWDLKSCSVIWRYDLPAQQDAASSVQQDITSLELNSDGSLVAAAPHSAIIKVSDGKLASKLSSIDGQDDVETVLFYNALYLTGSISGQVCLWDLNRQIALQKFDLPGAVTVMKLGMDDQVFVASDGVVYQCNIRTGTPLRELTGHRGDIHSISVSPDHSFVLTASDDATAKIFDTKL